MKLSLKWAALLLFTVFMLSIAAGCSTTSPSGANADTDSIKGTGTASGTQPGAAAGGTTDGQSGAGTGTATPPVSQQKPETPDKPVTEPVAMSQLSAVRIINPASGWVGGNGWIARTDDSGKQWKLQYRGKQKVEQIFALNGQDAWAVVAGGTTSNPHELIQSSDGGTNWKQAGNVPNGGFIHFVNKQEGFSANAYTADGGKSWSTLNVPEHIVGDAYFHDKSNGWAVTAEDKKIMVKRTTDGGKSWNTVLSRSTESFLNGTVIRSAGVDDVWVEWIGDSGMSQTSYSLFHSADGGKSWQPVLANSTAGAGPAPGFPADYQGTKNAGSKPGELYVIDPKNAFMGGYCPACDNPNTVGSTTDGGKTWINGKEQIPGSSGAMLAMSDALNGWWISRDAVNPSVLYTTSDGGKHWSPAHTFDPQPKQ